MKKMLPHLNGHVLSALGHLSATAMLTAGMALLVLPLDHAEGVFARLQAVPQLWEMSKFAIALHVGVAACLWALLFIVFQLVMLRVKEGKQVRHMKLATGTILTETLIVMPIFLLLTFGLGQLTINNIAGILANVASYEAARAAWVWQPEEDADDPRMGVEDGIAEEKCRIAVAFAMMPVAPANLDRESNKLNSRYADEARRLAAGANVPLSGALSEEFSPAILDTMFEISSIANTDDLAYGTALDSSDFLMRSLHKFTAAYQAAECDIKTDHSVAMTYKHRIAMPVVGPIFGESTEQKRTNIFGFERTTKVYIATYERKFGFTRQIATPNRKLPLNYLREDPPLPEGVKSKDDASSEVDSKTDKEYEKHED